MGLILGLATAPLYIAVERGYFAAEQIDLQFESVQITSEALTQVSAGNLEVANVTLGAAVLNSLVRGLDIKIVSGQLRLPTRRPGGNPFLVRKDLYDGGITDASGLRGRKVAGNSLGVFTEYAIDQALRTGGLTIEDVEFAQMAFPDIPVAFANRVIDAGFTIEPLSTIAVDQGTAVRIAPEVRPRRPADHPDGRPDRAARSCFDPKAYLRVFLRGVRQVMAEGFTPETAAIVEKYTRVPAATVQRVSLPTGTRNGRVNWESLMDQQRFYMARGSATYREPLDLQRLLSEDGLRQAALASLSR